MIFIKLEKMNKQEQYFKLSPLTARKYYPLLRRHSRSLDKSPQEPVDLDITGITWQE